MGVKLNMPPAPLIIDIKPTLYSVYPSTQHQQY